MVVDILLAAAVFGISAYPMAGQPRAMPALMLLGVQCVALGWRRSWPLTVLVVVSVTATVTSIVGLPVPVAPFAGLVALYSTGAYASRPRACAAGAVVAALVPVALAFDPRTYGLQVLVGYIAMFAVAWLSGTGSWHRRDQLRLLAMAAEGTARAAVAEERARMAREMHDVVAHHVSLIVLQAEAAQAVRSRPDASTGDPLETIAELGRQAVGDLRRTVAVLREPGAPSGVPAPGGAELAALAAAMNGAGMPSKLTIVGEAAPLGPAVAMAVYRIVQESLTNALKHSDRTRATVRVEHTESGVAVQVRSRGIPAQATGGYGLAGMRERATLVGGHLSAGPRDGFWEVTAVLPR